MDSLANEDIKYVDSEFVFSSESHRKVELVIKIGLETVTRLGLDSGTDTVTISTLESEPDVLVIRPYPESNSDLMEVVKVTRIVAETLREVLAGDPLRKAVVHTKSDGCYISISSKEIPRSLVHIPTEEYPLCVGAVTPEYMRFVDIEGDDVLSLAKHDENGVVLRGFNSVIEKYLIEKHGQVRKWEESSSVQLFLDWKTDDHIADVVDEGETVVRVRLTRMAKLHLDNFLGEDRLNKLIPMKTLRGSLLSDFGFHVEFKKERFKMINRGKHVLAKPNPTPLNESIVTEEQATNIKRISELVKQTLQENGIDYTTRLVLDQGDSVTPTFSIRSTFQQPSSNAVRIPDLENEATLFSSLQKFPDFHTSGEFLTDLDRLLEKYNILGIGKMFEIDEETGVKELRIRSTFEEDKELEEDVRERTLHHLHNFPVAMEKPLLSTYLVSRKRLPDLETLEEVEMYEAPFDSYLIVSTSEEEALKFHPDITSSYGLSEFFEDDKFNWKAFIEKRNELNLLLEEGGIPSPLIMLNSIVQKADSLWVSSTDELTVTCVGPVTNQDLVQDHKVLILERTQ